MDKKGWIKNIKKAACGVGTYRDEFDTIIDSLATILEQRDVVMDKYIAEGGEPIVVHVNKFGAPNPSKNPLLSLWNELNRDALSYWRDLGLTPSGLKKIREDEFIKEPEASDNIQRLVEMLGDD